MLISKAYAAASENADKLADMANAPSSAGLLLWNLGLVIVLVALFYLLLIMPQQKRFKEHSDMLSDLKKGDRVVTGGGLVGKIDRVLDDQEVLIDLGNGIKVTALRSMIQGKTDMKPRPAANDSTSKTSKDSKKV